LLPPFTAENLKLSGLLKALFGLFGVVFDRGRAKQIVERICEKENRTAAFCKKPSFDSICSWEDISREARFLKSGYRTKMPEVDAEEERRFMETSQGGMLDVERARASFDVEKLTNLIDGGAEETRRRRSVRGAIESDSMMDSRGRIFKTRRERYVEAMKRFHRGEKIVRDLGEDGRDVRNFMWVKDAPYLDDFPIALHFLMFMPNLKITCTEEQLQKWIPPSLSFKIIGCYAQTELGHGSNVRGIETTATFLPETVSPLLSSLPSLPHTEQSTALLISRFIKLNTQQQAIYTCCSHSPGTQPAG
jgi:hypothetical protein